MLRVTEKLFYIDPYLKESEAEVKDIISKDNKVFVVLDRTPFYPEGGGQPSDIGEIDDVKVTYVYEKGGVIYHQVSEAPKNKIVRCKIDFERRFDHMQQHSGEHLLSGAILKLFGGSNKGFHLGEDYVTIDIDIDSMSEDMMKRAEDEVNLYIFKNVDICTYVVTKEESENFPLRKKINVDENLRIVEAKNMDCCPCCGTHVLKTGEIGIIKIIKVERYKGMTRIYLKCGNRALRDFQSKQNVIAKLNRHLSSDESNLIQRVESQSLELERLRKELNNLKKVFAENEVENIIKIKKSSLVVKTYEDKTFEEVQLIGTLLFENRYIVILGSILENKVLFENNSDFGINCGKLFKDNIKEFKGKGGGNDKRAQGTFGNKDDLVKFIDFLFSYVNELIKQ